MSPGCAKGRTADLQSSSPPILTRSFPKARQSMFSATVTHLPHPASAMTRGTSWLLSKMFRALNRGGVSTKGDLIFLASAQEELGMVGSRHWLQSSGYK